MSSNKGYLRLLTPPFWGILMDTMAKVYFPRQAVLSGIIIRSTVDSGIIDTIRMPSMDESFLTIEPKDIRGENRIRIAGNSVPLLASNRVSYKGQPILALFGPDIENVQLKAKEADICYRLDETSQDDVPFPPVVRDFGDFEKAIGQEGIQSYSQHYDFARYGSPDWNITRITAGMAGGTLHITAPTQWLMHMRETVSDITRIPKKQVVIHRLPVYTPHDEMLIRPTFLAAITALACLKSGYTTEILDSSPVYRPAIHIERKSFFLSDGRPIAEEAHATVDQGAFPLFSEEMAKQMIAGLLPPCDLEAARLSIAFSSSSEPPANFFGGLGYSEALATTEEQTAHVALLSGLSPDEWKSRFTSAGGIHNEVVHTNHAAEMKASLAELCKRSDFSRKFNAYLLANRSSRKSPNLPLFGYTRGVALASGVGIAGFSSGEHKAISPLQVQLKLEAGNKVTVNTSFYGIGASAKIWSKVISEKLGIPENCVSFTEDGEEMVDSGPSVLANNSGRMLLLIDRAIELIKEKRFVKPLPLVVNVIDKQESGEYFDNTGWAMMVLELAIDNVSFEPMVRGIWIQALVGKLQDEAAYREKLRYTAISTLGENGATLAPGRDLTIDVQLKEVEEDWASSINSTVKALAMATFASALNQALGASGITLPVTCKAIMEAMTQRRTK